MKVLAGGNYQEAGAWDLCPLPEHNESVTENLPCIELYYTSW